MAQQPTQTASFRLNDVVVANFASLTARTLAYYQAVGKLAVSNVFGKTLTEACGGSGKGSGGTNNMLS